MAALRKGRTRRIVGHALLAISGTKSEYLGGRRHNSFLLVPLTSQFIQHHGSYSGFALTPCYQRCLASVGLPDCQCFTRYPEARRALWPTLGRPQPEEVSVLILAMDPEDSSEQETELPPHIL